MAISALPSPSRSAVALLMMPGVCLPERDDPLLPGRVLVPGAGAPAQGDDVGLLVAVHVGDLDLVAAGKVGVDDDAIERLLRVASGEWPVASRRERRQ